MIDPSDDDRTSADEIAIETVVLGPGSLAVGVAIEEVALPSGSDAVILAVLRDESPDLVEDEPVEPCHAGDRVVVSARRDRPARP